MVLKKLINGERMTVEECYEKHERFMWYKIKKFFPISKSLGMDKDDCFSVACIAFMKAYKKFDDSLGYKFSTYLGRVIEGNLANYLRDQSRTIKFSRKTLVLAMKIKGLGISHMDIRVIAEHLNVTIEDVQLAFLSMSRIKSLQEPVVKDKGEPILLQEQIGKEADISPMYVNEFMSQLKNRERKIVQLKLADKTQIEISKTTNLSQPQVSRLMKEVAHKYHCFVEVV